MDNYTEHIIGLDGTPIDVSSFPKNTPSDFPPMIGYGFDLSKVFPDQQVCKLSLTVDLDEAVFADIRVLLTGNQVAELGKALIKLEAQP